MLCNRSRKKKTDLPPDAVTNRQIAKAKITTLEFIFSNWASVERIFSEKIQEKINAFYSNGAFIYLLIYIYQNVLIDNFPCSRTRMQRDTFQSFLFSQEKWLLDHDHTDKKTEINQFKYTHESNLELRRLVTADLVKVSVALRKFWLRSC